MGLQTQIFPEINCDYQTDIPTSRSLASEVMTHKVSFMEYSPPAITNQWAMVQASRDITAYDDFAVSPVRCGEGKYTELFFGFSKDDFQSCTTMDIPVSFQWFPHGVKRQAQIKGLEVSSYLSLSTTSDVLQMKIGIKNQTNQPITFDLFVKTLFGLNCSSARIEYDPQWNAFECYDLTAQRAFAIQSVDKKPMGYGTYIDWEAWYHSAFYRHYNGPTIVHGKESDYATYGAFYYKLSLDPGEIWDLSYLHAMGEKEEQVRLEHQLARDHYEEELRATERNWDEEIRAAFTPDNDRFSGHLPVLQSSDPSLKRLYDMSVLSLLLLKRTRKMGQPAKVYATGMPGWVHCFLWDTQAVSSVIALLDPKTLKNMIEFWIVKDPSTFMATNYVTDEGEAVWYAINDFAMCYMMYSYLSSTGDEEWLNQTINGKSVMDHFEYFATHFLERMDEDYLVNYGDSRNLLECVFSYAYKVPAFNATNVWSLRRLSELWERKGNLEKSDKYQQLAAKIAENVMTLYEQGQGYWNCKYPDSQHVPVRTCVDYNYLFLGMNEDLPQQVKDEMIQFFKRELMTETWMHALSPLDPDTKNSVRTDHQDNGAFVSWPAHGLLGMLRSGHIDDALRWIGVGRERGIVTVTKQGPWGQAYFHGGEGSFLEFGAAMKAAKEYPFIERFALLTGGMYVSLMIEEMFGLKADWGGLVVKPALEKSLSDQVLNASIEMTLYNLTIQGKTVHAKWKR